MAETPRFIKLDWKGGGYFGFPLPEEVRLASTRDWSDFERILAQAKQGDFREIPRLLELYDQCEGWLLSSGYMTLLGDAASPSLFRKIAMLSEQTDVFPIYYEAGFCEALTAWGQLSVVPAMLGVLESGHEYQDADKLPELLSWLLEEAPGEIVKFPEAEQLVQYRTRVLNRYEELKRRFGQISSSSSEESASALGAWPGTSSNAWTPTGSIPTCAAGSRPRRGWTAARSTETKSCSRARPPPWSSVSSRGPRRLGTRKVSGTSSDTLSRRIDRCSLW
jgi:hypothetical protein